MRNQNKKRLGKLANRSSILDINLQINNERVKFNLLEELKITPSRVNEELIEQPTHYAYLSLLLIRAKAEKDKKEHYLEKMRNSIFIDFKSDTDENTGRPYSNDVAEAYITEQEDYQDALEKFQQAEQDWLILKTCVESFQQRKDLLQSLSANIRQERNVN